MENIMQCKRLGKRFGHKVALEGVDLEIPKGRIIGLLGPNGSGKTTLIKLANGLLTPDEGTITVGDNAPGVASKKIVSYLPERTYLSDWMRVSDLLNFFEDFYDDFDRGRALTMLGNLDIQPADRIKACLLYTSLSWSRPTPPSARARRPGWSGGTFCLCTPKCWRIRSALA